MNKIKIISDTSCDLNATDYEKYDISFVPFTVSINGEENLLHRVQLSDDDFYQALIDNPKYRPKSACPSPGDYLELFKDAVKNNQSVICFCLTQKFSGSYNSALVAADMVREEFNDAVISVIDTACITVLQGLLVKNCFAMIKDGLTHDEIVLNIEKLKESARILFTIGSMDYLKRGGRIGKLITILFSKVNVRPIINFEEGDISSSGVTIGRGKSVAKVIEKIKQFFTDEKINIDEYDLAVGYGYDKAEGENFLEKMQALFSGISDKVKVYFAQIGAVIAVHTGPLPLGLGFIKKYKPKAE